VVAEELYFPKTETEIVDTLRNEDSKSLTTSDGTKYIAEKGKVYKIINGKRFTLRGIQVVEALDLLPKAGALINFDFDSAKINSESHSLLDEFGKALKYGLPHAMIMIAGHTDSKGSIKYNQNLSEIRAEAVIEYLKKYHGIKSERFVTRGFGETQPIVENDTKENRYKNRRVEFIRIQ